MMAGAFGAWTPYRRGRDSERVRGRPAVARDRSIYGLGHDNTGNEVGNATGRFVREQAAALKSLELSFHQDLNSDGVIGVPATVIEVRLDQLVQTGNNYFLDSIAAAPAPS